MSSHHIVKEKQEPALYIDELGDFDEELLGQLLEWSPTLLVNAEGYDKVLSLGLKVDVLVNGDPQNTQENTKVIQAKFEPLIVAINYLVAEKYPAVNVITNTFEIERFGCFSDKINLVVFTAKSKHYTIKSGFSVWKPAGIEFQIFGNADVEMSNVKEINERIFEVEKDGFVIFNFAGKSIFISEPI
ncbi:thiamine pyrophosphokinase [Pedobacter changchengzhani]|uniref:Thiamine pyrophosphokinase n=1 Tax=Pedobacter changchengzhani TaxID=2529274 RepID=A0A4R5MPL5_9SPHI|nr:thiamine pyrophosphokinase [Pedobacter changchengzhani]TDG37576.1 thiamine pyrophosphokinase [Pedobacter changchengzhani]